MTARARGRVRLVVLVLLALVAGGCSGGEPADPQQRLGEALERTFDGPFSYRFAAQADREALDALGDAAGQAASFLNTFAVTGAVDGDRTSVQVRLAGSEPALELRTIGDDLYVRAGIVDLLGSQGLQLDLEERVLPAMQELGLPRSVREGVVALFAGRWVGVEGAMEGDLASLLGATDAPAEATPAADGALASELGGNLPGFVQRFVQVDDEVADDGLRRYDVRLQLHALLRTVAEVGAEVSLGGVVELAALEEQLAALPELVDGRIVVDDGLVTSMRFDVGAAAREAGQEVPGTIELRLDLADHGRVALVEVPVDVVAVPSRDLATSLTALLAAFG